MGQQELDTGEVTIVCSSDESCPLIFTSDIDVQFVCDEGLHHILVSVVGAKMKSSVPLAVPAGDLGSVLQEFGDTLIITRVGSSNKILISLLVLITSTETFLPAAVSTQAVIQERLDNIPLTKPYSKIYNSLSSIIS